MLEHLELSFEGRPHCGLDDARNIARVLIRMMYDGASIQVNERIHLLTLEAKSKMSSQPERVVMPVTASNPYHVDVKGQERQSQRDCQSISNGDST